MSPIKVVWYVLKVENIHCWSSLDPWGPWGKAISSYIHNFILQGRVKLRILKLASVFHHIPLWSQVVVRVGTPRIYPLLMFYSKLVCNWVFQHLQCTYITSCKNFFVILFHFWLFHSLFHLTVFPTCSTYWGKYIWINNDFEEKRVLEYTPYF